LQNSSQNPKFQNKPGNKKEIYSTENNANIRLGIFSLEFESWNLL